MFARNFVASPKQRRGVVLVVILGMLGLLALIGVTFATFSGQSQLSARKFAEGFSFPDSSQLMDFAMSQLIYDTDNVASALRGHSLARDMYGNDARGNGLLGQLPAPYGTQIYFIPGLVRPNPNPGPLFGYPQYVINVPTNQGAMAFTPTLFGVNFTRWYVRIGAWTGYDIANNHAVYHEAQTFEVLADDDTGSDPFSQAQDPISGISATMHILTLATSNPLVTPTPALPLYDTQTVNSFNNSINVSVYTGGTNQAYSYFGSSTFLAVPGDANPNVPNTNFPSGFTPIPVVLDGRFRRAFNGPGMSALSYNYTNTNPNVGIAAAMYGNFRINGGLLTGNPTLGGIGPGDPDLVGMDEDYDAVDLENWFLAMQSADGSVVIPSFHRPGILTFDANNANPLDPNSTLPYDDWRSALPNSAAKILRPRQFDNPASGLPDLKPNATGQIAYDVDNDGDGISDSVWLDLGYQAVRDPTGKMFKPLFAFTVIGLNGRMPLNTVGNLQKRDYNDYNGDGNPDCAPLWDHTSHLGYSVSEINPKYALQNAPVAGYSQFDNGNSYWPNGGGPVPVDLTQLRNLLAGTRPQANPYLPPTEPPNSNPSNLNGDTNFVLMGTQIDPQSQTVVPRYFWLPNNMYDPLIDASQGRVAPVVPGRWGEAQGVPAILPDPTNPAQVPAGFNYLAYNNMVRAGVSPGLDQFNSPLTKNNYNIDQTDDNMTSLDPFGTGSATLPSPPYPSAAPANPNPEVLDLFDAAGFQMLPSERLRRFSMPLDVAGTGRVYSRNYTPSLADLDFGLGYDSRGRVEFFRYFRPPGVPISVGIDPTQSPAQLLPNPGQVSYPNATSGMTAVVPDLTTNLYHGHEAWRRPRNSQVSATTGDSTRPAAQTAAAPFVMAPGGPYGLPTFTYANPPTATTPPHNVNSSDPSSGPFPYPGGGTLQDYSTYLMGVLGRDEADEMNLYNPSEYDAPFGPADLEWLYRKHDTDGGSLDSRLAKLAPISFTNDQDGVTRRRLFSIDTWDTTNFIWANDNPINLPNYPGVPKGLLTAANVVLEGQFPLNSRFNLIGAFYTGNSGYSANNLNASFEHSTANLFVGLNGRTVAPQVPVFYTQPVPNTIPPPIFVPTYPVEHRDRKINLNFPLPVSNDPAEPVRQKWIRETYQTLKSVLPPEAIDTPQELAQLSQFVVNIIDFRDPDATCTRFVNTDVTLKTQPSNTTTPPTPATWQFNQGPPPVIPNTTPAQFYNPYDSRIANDPVNVGDPLVQYGMEYSPVVLNEVLAYSFLSQGANGSAVATPRMFVELLNTLTSNASDVAGGNASDLDLKGWNFVVTPDDPTGRPDPTTGQIPPKPATVTGTLFTAYPVSGTAGSGLTAPLPALSPNPTYYVVSNPGPAGNAESGLPANVHPIINQAMVPTPPASSTAQYYWLYLTRPINPIDPVPTGVQPNDVDGNGNARQVVVDAIRFPFIESGGKVSGATPPVVTRGQNALYSVQRMQPFRGGQNIPASGASSTPPVVTPEEQLHPYGWSEQLGVTQTSTGQRGNFGNTQITGNIYHTLTTQNVDGAGNPEKAWDYFPFHDRDFASVAELLLVPSCPPGLFTKKFTELAPNPSFPNSTSTVNKTPSLGSTPPKYPDAGLAFDTYAPTTPTTRSYTVPHTFPYLADSFFYTSAQEATAPNVFGLASGGWFKMFDVFEVPSSAFGAIGPVAQGQNFDWFRQDLRPGQLNINLIIDEEVFLGLIDDPRLNMAQTALVPNSTPPQFLPIPPPQVVTRVNAAGTPTASYAMNNRGWYALDPVSGNLGNLMKASFSDFLKLRAGGSGFIFAWGLGLTGAPNVNVSGFAPADPHYYYGVAAEQPFRSYSYPDIDATIMRPATLAPSALTTPIKQTATPPNPWPATQALPVFVQDPGLRSSNTQLAGSTTPPTLPAQPQPIPARRLFQIPDDYDFPLPPNPPPTPAPPTTYPSNASETGDPYINSPVLDGNLYNPKTDLMTPLTPASTVDWMLGGTNTNDFRQHPYYRTELLQKVTNLTTVRTHQYAVWVTVGFFEVVQQGNPQFNIPDKLGAEIGLAGGRNIRYRSFFVVDRTKAVGFNSPWPGVAPEDFRDCVIYRRKIE